jgi:copper chaperone CopZ
MAVEYLLVPGIAGANDVRVISAALAPLPGVLLVTVSLPNRRVRVEHDGHTSAEVLLRAINEAGYDQVALLA